MNTRTRQGGGQEIRSIQSEMQVLKAYWQEFKENFTPAYSHFTQIGVRRPAYIFNNNGLVMLK